ncbi:MAG: hypothetical protein EF813_05255 [Methanosarcinales archaeon]|nr:MAG: hypothetical protein EF813_05255 [Methanosarcinales archaeon]
MPTYQFNVASLQREMPESPYSASKAWKGGMDAMEILSVFEGVAVQDRWTPHLNYTDVIHALCNAHHLRDRTFERVQCECGLGWKR